MKTNEKKWEYTTKKIKCPRCKKTPIKLICHFELSPNSRIPVHFECPNCGLKGIIGYLHPYLGFKWEDQNEG
jgi:hypothetical protein